MNSVSFASESWFTAGKVSVKPKDRPRFDTSDILALIVSPDRRSITLPNMRSLMMRCLFLMIFSLQFNCRLIVI